MELKLKLDFEIQPLDVKLKHGDKCVLLGSCFSNEIGAHFRENGFDILSNPFGTIFHPEPISRILSETVSGIYSERMFERKDLCFSWDASGSVFGYSENELLEELKIRRKKLIHYLRTSKYLFITFGSAYGYVENESLEIVSNCHKMPGNTFTKELTSLDLMYESWIKTLNQLYLVNPEIQVIFTISPIRHVKDGLIENNRSKARLFELISALEHFQNVHYFPSYEIVVDELRDYRFYKNDGIHPDSQAVQYVWNRLKLFLFSRETQLICDVIVALRKLENHDSLYPQSKETIRFKADSEKKISSFLALHPEVLWNEKP